MSDPSKPGDLQDTQEIALPGKQTGSTAENAQRVPAEKDAEHEPATKPDSEAAEAGEKEDNELRDEGQAGGKPEPAAADVEESGSAAQPPLEPAEAQKVAEPALESARSREEIEDEISAHLASRAGQLSLDTTIPADSAGQDRPAVGEQAGIASTTPPRPPPKDDHTGLEAPPALPESTLRTERDASNVEEEQDASQGSAEAGSEISNIMHQFQDGMGGPGMEEIMSPRLEMAQPMFQPPPRTSSLEPQQSYTLNRQNTGQSVDSHRTGKAPSISNTSLHQVISPGQESTGSRPSSIFQSPPPAPDPEPPLPFDFHRFLEQLRHRTADPVARFLRSFLLEFGKKQWMVHEQVKIISDFLEFIAKKMATCDVWRTVSDAEFDNAREGMEKLVMNRLYTQTFSPAIPDPAQSPRKGKSIRQEATVLYGPGRRGQHQEDVERDDVIAQKIRIYGWIREEHLDINPLGEKGRKFILLAQQELLKINAYRAPRDKVICVLNCCKVIFGFLRSSKSDQSADAFVPLLIYTVLRAHPEHLVSNVQYIWRFRNQDKLGGEAGYYMSSLMGVVTFIENLDRTNLTVSDEEFEQNVEQAVSAIAEGHKADEYEEKTHAAASSAPMQHLSEKSALSRPEVTPRNSMEAERSSPRRNVSQRMSEKSSVGDDEEPDAVTGLLRTIQKPIAQIGRILSDEGSTQQAIVGTGLRPASTPQPGSTPRGLSPAPKLERKPSGDARVQPPPLPDRDRSRQKMTAEDAAARQASAETAEAQRVRLQEHRVVVESVHPPEPSLLASVADLIR